MVADDNGRVRHFQEKPAPGTALAMTVNTGSYLIEPEALAGIAPGQPAMWETDIFPALIGAGAPVFAFQARHLWLDTGTPRRLFCRPGCGTRSKRIDARRRTSVGAGPRPTSASMLARTVVHRSRSATAQSSLQAPRCRGPTSIGRECHVLPGATHRAQRDLGSLSDRNRRSHQRQHPRLQLLCCRTGNRGRSIARRWGDRSARSPYSSWQPDCTRKRSASNASGDLQMPDLELEAGRCVYP